MKERISEKREIERTCVGCRMKKPKCELFRYVLREGCFVQEDPSGILPGRGAYLCRNAECMKLALKKNAFSKAFRRRADVSGIAGTENG